MLALIPGLGCDHRVFAHLRLAAPQQQVLRYIAPAAPDEPLADYAARLGQQLADPARTVLVGMSLGGLLAIELARQLPIRRVAIVSSLKSAHERSPLLSALGRLPLHRALPAPALKWLNAATADHFMGVNTAAEALLLHELIAATDAHFLQWAIHQVLTWTNTWQPPGLIHLHGTDDRVFPARHIGPAHWLEGATHWMILQRAPEISALLNAELASEW